MRCVLTMFQLMVIAAVLSITTSSIAQTTRPFVIHHHERIADLPPQAPDSARAPAQTAQQYSITAFGKTFQLELLPNDQLIAHLPMAQKQRLAQKIKLLRGQLTGIKGSWVRLSQQGERYSGVIWDGSELYVLDHSDAISNALAVPGTGSYQLIYRLKDASWPNAACALDPNSKPLNDYSALVRELNVLAEALPAAARELSVAIVADVQFVRINPLDPEAAVVARMNVVDGIYSEQVGVHLRIARIQSLSSNGTLSATNSSTLLSQFSNFAAAPGFANPGLAHLFTGRDLDGNIIGIAFLSSLCDARFGTGLSQINGAGTAGALIVAHEFGHNFGAPHDNQAGSPCATTPNGFIMNPSINGSDTFSACSLQQMRPVISAAACITPITVGSADLRPALPVNPINAAVGTNFSYRVEVRNGGSVAATGSSATIGIPNGLQLQSSSTTQGTCTNSATQVVCNLGSLAAAATGTVTLTLRGASAGSFTSNITVAASNDSNAGNNTAQAVITLGGVGTTTLFQAHFDTGSDGFAYLDDAFRATRQPTYASGARSATTGFSGGGLFVTLGGIDNRAVLNMSGGWRRAFSLTASRQVSVALRVKVNQSAFYETDELTQALLSIDGRLLSQVAGRDYVVQVRGDGETGSTLSSGWQQITVNLGTLAAGSHTLTIGGHNNKKTFGNELSRIYIDDVVLTAR